MFGITPEELDAEIEKALAEPVAPMPDTTTKSIDEVRRAVRDLVWASPAISFLGHDFNDRETRRTDFVNLVTATAMHAVVKQMRVLAERENKSRKTNYFTWFLNEFEKEAGV